ncbi:MAG: hypothetical protein GF315_06120 [candidate division Zixibacteria bacterium]|nr:hypothetical protein [candidate division Zixibacteria bacterium]
MGGLSLIIGGFIMLNQDRSPEKAVRAALGKLESIEREVIIRYYFMGQGLRQIADTLELSVYSVRSRLNGGTLKLRSLLARFVSRKYGLRIRKRKSCPLCENSRFDHIILNCGPIGPWKPVFKQMEAVGFEGVKSVRTIIHHYEKHLNGGEWDE